MPQPNTIYTEHRWFEDFAIGQTFTYGDWEMTLEQMLAFAELYDPEPFHLNKEKAIALGWKDIIASGPQLSAIWRRLSKDAFPSAQIVISPGWDKIRWLSPVYAGDRISAETTISQSRKLDSRPGEGMIILDNRLLRNSREPVATLSSTWFVRTKN